MRDVFEHNIDINSIVEMLSNVSQSIYSIKICIYFFERGILNACVPLTHMRRSRIFIEIIEIANQLTLSFDLILSMIMMIHA